MENEEEKVINTEEQENEIGEKFLPIGTIVLLKGGKKELMIVSYCIFPQGEVYDKNGKLDDAEFGERMYEYGGCVYPEGMLSSDQLFAFNHEQIAKVLYRGYDTQKQKDISNILIAAMEERDKRANGDEVSKLVKEDEVSEETSQPVIPEE